MKLFGERHLGGEVSFVSTAREGTVFSIPAAPAAARRRLTARSPPRQNLPDPR
jgi:hypothetical protein